MVWFSGGYYLTLHSFCKVSQYFPFFLESKSHFQTGDDPMCIFLFQNSLSAACVTNILWYLNLSLPDTSLPSDFIFTFLKAQVVQEELPFASS